MSPAIALLLWLVVTSWLLYSDPGRERRTSAALWIPMAWIFILATRLPSQWLGGGMGEDVNALEQGNPIDSTIYSLLIFMAIGVLVTRSFNWGSFFARNTALMAFLCFALMSAAWSDFHLIALKRWFRDLGNYLVILVALSDPVPFEAVRTLLRRLCYLLVPLSVLVIKYYPYISRRYDVWTGVPEYVGPTTSKNMLGVLCLITGLFLFWDTVMRWSQSKEPRTKRIIIVNVILFYWVVWLLFMSNSATSRLCLTLGCVIIAAAQTRLVKRRPALLRVGVPTVMCLYFVLAFGFGLDINSLVTGAAGRDSTFTGRTVIWNAVLSMHTNFLLGTGYESFWLGPRLAEVWAITGGGINEAHDGYLEIYLNLGLIGLFLLIGFLVASYRTICARLTGLSSLGSLSFALWTILPIYNVTESAFRGQLMFIVFLFGAIVIPRAAGTQQRSTLSAPSPSVIQTSSVDVNEPAL